jgi:hypothetical protein
MSNRGRPIPTTRNHVFGDYPCPGRGPLQVTPAPQGVAPPPHAAPPGRPPARGRKIVNSATPCHHALERPPSPTSGARRLGTLCAYMKRCMNAAYAAPTVWAGRIGGNHELRIATRHEKHVLILDDVESVANLLHKVACKEHPGHHQGLQQRACASALEDPTLITPASRWPFWISWWAPNPASRCTGACANSSPPCPIVLMSGLCVQRGDSAPVGQGPPHGFYAQAV